MARLRLAPEAHHPRTLDRGASRAAGLALALSILACGGKNGGKGGASSGQAAASASQAPTASGSAASSSAPPVVDETPQGSGITHVDPIDKTKCAPASIDLATYLQRGELTIAARDGQIAASWLVQLKDKAQIGFAGFDGEAKRIARDRGIGNAREHAPTLFPSGADWIVTWFDGDGLAYARPRWEAQPGPEISHLTTVKDLPPDEVAIAPTPDGALVAASSFGTQGDQLSLFMFATLDGSQKAQALGFTKHAKKPHHPAVAADGNGYALAWLEEDGHVAATRLDLSGKEVGSSATVVGKPSEGEPTDVTLVATATGFEITWSLGDTVFTRPLSKDATPAGPPLVVGKGHFPRTAATNGLVYIAFLGEAEGKPQQLLVLGVTPSAPSTSAVRISDGVSEVKDPPSIAIAGDRVAIAWTEVMSPAVSTKRATLRLVNAACIP